MDDYWIPGQRMMGDIKFLDSLRAFDKDNVPQHIMEKIRIKYINMELFDPNNVKKVCIYDIIILFCVLDLLNTSYMLLISFNLYS